MKAWVAIGAALAVAAMGGAALAQGKAAGLRGNPGQFFGPDDYPPEAVRAAQQGRVVVKLSIDTSGKVASCTLTSSSGSPSLDQKTCAIALEKVTFTPATDRRGHPIAATYTLPVRWVLPTGDTPGPPIEIAGRAPTPSTIEFDVTVGGGGIVERCVVSEATPLPSSDPCVQYPVGFRINGGYTRNGTPVRTHTIFRFSTRTTVEP